jgi:hypothetical protein
MGGLLLSFALRGFYDMSDSNSASVPLPPNQPPADQITQQVNYSQISARVPEERNRGVFANNGVVLTGNQEFVCDFLLRMVPPQLLAARVVMPYTALAPMLKAMQENFENYRNRFGVPVGPPTPPPNAPQPKFSEVYEQLKITDEVAVGSYANTMMISHTATEFCMDFIFDLFPRPVVTQRVYMAAGQLPGLINSLKRTLEQVQQRSQPQPPTALPPQSPPAKEI